MIHLQIILGLNIPIFGGLLGRYLKTKRRNDKRKWFLKTSTTRGKVHEQDLKPRSEVSAGQANIQTLRLSLPLYEARLLKIKVVLIVGCSRHSW